MKLAAAQIAVQTGQINENLEQHFRAIEIAAQNNVELLFFPEMSITGYCRTEARALAFFEKDSRLQSLQELATKHNLIIIAGAPINIRNQLYIGSFIICPDRKIQMYTKQYLHEGEEHFFTPSKNYNPLIKLGGELLALAICADINNSAHPKSAKENKATVYLPSIFYSKKGILEGHQVLNSYARQFKLPTLMSNYCGKHWNTQAGGKSAFWNEKGHLLSVLESGCTGLLIAEKANEDWRVQTRRMN